MKATIEDLKKGDVVIVNLGSVLAEVKLLRQPQLAKTGKKTNWKGVNRWTSVPCAFREETFTYKTSYSNSVWTQKKPVIANGAEYNVEKRIDFTDKICWIIKRENS